MGSKVLRNVGNFGTSRALQELLVASDSQNRRAPARRSTMPGLHRVVVVVLLAAVAGCGSSGDAATGSSGSLAGDQSAVEEFLAVVGATEQASSYTMTVSDPAASGPPSSVVYQAPDRYHQTLTIEGAPPQAAVPVPESSNEITIGETQWREDWDEPGSWTVEPLPQERAGLRSDFGIFEILNEATEAVRTDDGFTFTTMGWTGSATVSDGFLETVTIEQPAWQTEDGFTFPARRTEHRFSAIGSSPSVEPPPAATVRPADSIPSCDSAGPEEGVCLEATG